MFESMQSHHRDVYDSLSKRTWVRDFSAGCDLVEGLGEGEGGEEGRHLYFK